MEDEGERKTVCVCERDSVNVSIANKSAPANTYSQMSGDIANYLLSNVRIYV